MIIQGRQSLDPDLPKIETELRSNTVQTTGSSARTFADSVDFSRGGRFRRSGMAWRQRAPIAGWRCKMHARMMGNDAHLHQEQSSTMHPFCIGQSAHGSVSRIMHAGGRDAPPWARRESASARHFRNFWFDMRAAAFVLLTWP